MSHAKKHNSKAAEHTALALIEESIHQLRRAPLSVYIFHFLGAGTWLLGILFAWAYVSWFRPARDEIALGACALVALYAWLKVMQTEMCARLMAHRLGTQPEKFTLKRALRLAASQFGPHAWGPVAIIASAFLIIPFSRVWLYFQNITITGGDDLHKPTDAWTLANLWPRQTLSGVLLLAFITLAVGANIFATFYTVPWLARTLLGMDNMMAVSGWTPFNTTYLMSVCALTWFIVEPLAKTFCVLRVYRGRALRTGADLQIEMDNAGIIRANTRTLRHGAFAALILLLCVIIPTPTIADPTATPTTTETQPPPATDVTPGELNQAIDEVLARRDFRWQLSPQENAQTQNAEANPSAITRFFNWLGDGLQTIGKSIGHFIDWLHDLFTNDNRTTNPEPMVKKKDGSASGGLPLLKIFLYAMIALLVGLIAWVLYTALRNPDKTTLRAKKAAPIAETKPDLHDENTQATQLPTDGWLQLAREQAARGDWRLALRALYLAHLARLDTEGLVTLRRYKTNLDYEREVRRRALQRAELAEWFSKRRREFEATWYGRETPDEARVRDWFAEVEKGAATLT